MKWCSTARVRRACGRDVVLRLLPKKEDYFILKPKHSGFFATSLVPLLEFLKVDRLILAGIATNLCVFFTAHDVHMHEYGITVLSVPPAPPKAMPTTISPSTSFNGSLGFGCAEEMRWNSDGAGRNAKRESKSQHLKLEIQMANQIRSSNDQTKKPSQRRGFEFRHSVI